jgi:hypothetical protein
VGTSPWHTDLDARFAGHGAVTGVLDVRVGPVACLATLPGVTVALPAGEWRILASLGSEPDATAPPPVRHEQLVTLELPGEVRTDPLRLRVYRSLAEPTVVRASVRVERRTPAGWEPNGRPAAAAVDLPPVEPSGALPRWGSNLHIFIPGDRPPGSLDPFLDRMASAGMSLVRTSIPWSILCPSSDAFDAIALAQADAFFAGCERTGVQAIPIVDAHCPAWAEGDAPGVPLSWDGYADFAARCLARWGHTFAAILTQNEPNHEGHVNEFGPEHVVAAARAARVALEASPFGAAVGLLGPGIAYGDGAYLALLLDAGLGDVVDGIACHPYAVRFDLGPPSFRAPERPWGDAAGDPNHLASGVEAIRETLDARGLDLPVWVNEYGLSTSRTGPDGARSGLDVTESEQAAWLATAVRQAAAIPYLRSFCTYMLHDNPWRGVDARYAEVVPDDTAWHTCFGLMSHDGRHDKPAWRALVDAITAAEAAALR